MENPDPREQKLDAWLALTEQNSSHEGTVQLPVLSGSMLPAIPPGAILEIELTKGFTCRVGEVVVFRESQDRLTAHRVLACLKFGPFHWLLQKGDNNTLGNWISSSRVGGLVLRVLPGDETCEDCADVSPGSPYSLSIALASRRQHFRNLALKWPRRIRDSLFPASRPRTEVRTKEQNDSSGKQ